MLCQPQASKQTEPITICARHTTSTSTTNTIATVTNDNFNKAPSANKSKHSRAARALVAKNATLAYSMAVELQIEGFEAPLYIGLYMVAHE